MITSEFLKQCFPQATAQSCDTFAAPLDKALKEYDITSKDRVAAYLAQIGHESGNLKYVKENLNYSAEGLRKTFSKYFPTDQIAQQYQRNPEKIANRVYANRMGNGSEESGDGWKYRGRGLIQLTGKNNYQNCMSALGISDPMYLETPEGAVYSSCWFWKTNKLNPLADVQNMREITRIINGGYNGLDDRMSHYDHILDVLGR